MASLAFVATEAIVCIVFSMAAVTRRRCDTISHVLVAIITSRVLVLSEQRVIGRVVIKIDLQPVGFAVTFSATRA